MVRIRLTRTGRKNYAQYRVVVTPKREKRDSMAIEILGSYNPHTKELKLNKERAAYWISVGAQPSESVARLLVKDGVMKKVETKKTFNKKPGKKAVERREAAEAKKAEAEKPKEEVVEEAPAEEAAA